MSWIPRTQESRADKAGLMTHQLRASSPVFCSGIGDTETAADCISSTTTVYSPQAGTSIAAGESPSPTISVRVEGLTKDIVEEDLRTVFQVFGKVICVKILPDNGYALVGYTQRVDAEKAFQWPDGIPIKGIYVRVLPLET
ncbi:uncharacterized protein PV06_11272 [Exophiala oligosperma]|uniref:RRM domain-containing protein n=1 Tax=Exophiala oligosperma TaxID=215243 RepID=A0A0D2CZV1_9EURO|nr:uncharacterized protein PV06_11272 [Exophiala oligosperma]KIW36508.1 hypothetical protein PV06_11272 [Exophiala oligosperma]